MWRQSRTTDNHPRTQWTEVKSQDFLRDQWGQSATLEPRTAKSTFTQGGRTEGHRGAAGGVRHFGRERQGLRHSRNTKSLQHRLHTHTEGKGGSHQSRGQQSTGVQSSHSLNFPEQSISNILLYCPYNEISLYEKLFRKLLLSTSS